MGESEAGTFDERKGAKHRMEATVETAWVGGQTLQPQCSSSGIGERRNIVEQSGNRRKRVRVGESSDCKADTPP